MAIAVFTHPSCLEHDPGSGHPETSARLRAVIDRIGQERDLMLQDAPPASRGPLLKVHPSGYLDTLQAMSARGGGALFLDTVLSAGSWDAALGAAGAALAAIEHAITGKGHAFAAIRPPGHHALAGKGMGFCLMNNVVIAARHAQAAGFRQALIIDWDVHHGNGTQALIEADATVRYVSLHQYPWYPGTGAADERGVGNVFNVPRGPGKPASLYVDDLWAAVMAATTAWPPDLILISAGFDAMSGDPLGGFTLEPEHYADLTTRLRQHLPSAPIVGMMEGGYIPERLAEGVIAHLRALS